MAFRLHSFAKSFAFDIYFVNIAVVLLQAIREEELQAYDAYEGRFGGVEVKTDKVKKESTKKLGVIQLHLLELFNFMHFTKCNND